MIHISDPSACCGCTACASICPQDAITMEPDALGFLYPRVDASRCVACGRCEQVCAFNDHYDTSLNLPAPLAYGARHKDMHEVETSRSGAAFIALSDHILAQGGVVYGAGYKDHFRVCHKRATTREERDEFKGSKYVQSDLTGIFRQVKRDLKDGLLVLFSGTPCQTAGLNAYIGKRLRERLILIDIVCMGVPGPYAWRDYLAYLERKQGSPIVWVNFRDKQRFGWAAHKESFKFLNSDKSLATHCKFYQHITFRRSCGVCHFSNPRRPSDITLADFWGWEFFNKESNKDDKGLSLIFINTKKGVALFEAVKGQLDYFSVDFELASKTHKRRPRGIHPQRDAFEKIFIEHGLEQAFRKYGFIGWRLYYNNCKEELQRIVRHIKHNIDKKVKKLCPKSI